MEPAPISESERAFYVEEFSGHTVVVSVATLSSETTAVVGRAAASIDEGNGQLVLVVGADDHQPSLDALSAALPAPPVVLNAPPAELSERWLAELWLAITDRHEVVVAVPPGEEAVVAARLAVALRALKLVVTDPDGGWGRPARSFADTQTHSEAFEAQLADRQKGAVLAALREALDGGVTNVNLCRSGEIDRELFTFDGAGTLFTSGGYVEIVPLRVDDLPAVESLVAQGTADGLLRPRSRLEVAHLAVSGLGAKVVGSGHLAGLVSLDTTTFGAESMGEVLCLYTISRFSGAGSGAMLVDALLAQAEASGLESVFAVTVSDLAASFFERQGFREVSHDQIPVGKWQGYDPDRKAQARAFLRTTASF